MKRQHDAKDSLAMLPWFPRDWRASNKRATMSPLARLAYLELLFAAWLEPDCSLPADDAHLAALAGVPLAQWSKVGPEVAPAFERGSDGRLRSPRLYREHRLALERRDNRRTGAAKTNSQRTVTVPVTAPVTAPVTVPASARLALTESSFEVHGERTPASASASAVRKTNQSDAHARASKPNPFVDADRPKWEREALELTASIGELTGEDGAEVFAKAAHYDGALRQKVNPAGMSSDRLANTVLDLRATLKAEQAKRGIKPLRQVGT